MATLRCWRQPRVVILTTGDELRGADQGLGESAIYDSNGPMIDALVREAGGRTQRMRVADDPAALRDALEEALQADVLISTGGVSVGDHDHMVQAFADAGVTQVFHKVRLKPGKPVYFGRRDVDGATVTRVLGLPGNPVSAFVTFHLFAAPLLARLAGRDLPAWQEVALAQRVQRGGQRTALLRARMVDGRALPFHDQSSGALHDLVAADVLLRMDHASYDAGARVPALRLTSHVLE